jgi:DNA-directed RNA polymerase subunit RPC12/RpoP
MKEERVPRETDGEIEAVTIVEGRDCPECEHNIAEDEARCENCGKRVE